MSHNVSNNLPIGNCSIHGNVVLAPMAGITDFVFRRMSYRLGASYTVSEMVAAKEYCRKSTEAQARALLTKEGPQVVQIVGCNPENLAEVSKIVEGSGADIIDINMGCPSRKVVGGYGGASLMKQPDLVQKIIESIVQNVTIPVTVKMRLGWDELSLNADKISLIAQENGVKAVTIHGRTRNQKYSGKADWNAIKTLTRGLKIPVIANGDIQNVSDALNCFKQSQAQGVMVGRAATGKPWLVGQINKALKKEVSGTLSLKQKNVIIQELFEETLLFYGIQVGLKHMRKHISAYIDDLNKEACYIEPDMRTKLLSEMNPENVLFYLNSLDNLLEFNMT